MTSSAPLLDARGCLTPAGVAVLAAAPPGQGPPELASHVVSCARCQARLLAHGQGDQRSAPTSRPSFGRTLAVAAVLVVALLMALFTMLKLAGS